jgi:diguanylate cyclase (GGDEF)-like protein
MVHQEKLASVLSEFASTLVTDFTLDRILDRLVRRTIEVLPVTSAGITLITPGIHPRHVAASDARATRFEVLQSDLFPGPSLLAYDTNAAVEVPDLRLENRFPLFTQAALNTGMGAVFAFPLRRGANRLGVLELYRDSPGLLESHDLEAAQTLANVAAVYLTNVQTRIDADTAANGARESGLRDVLTGLPNRLLLSERMAHAGQRAKHSPSNSAVFFTNLDRFKLVNDTYGHQVGDALLVAVAHRLGTLIRPADTLARVSADEFVVFCEDVPDLSYVEVLAKRIDKSFAFPFDVLGLAISITASVGMAFARRGEETADQLVNDADTAMDQRKRKGGAGHQIIDLREATRAAEWNALECDLRLAVADKQLQLAYQPVVRSSDGLMTGVEALLRWTHPVRGPISPETVVAMAEHAGLITEIGTWVLEQACRDHRQWLDRFPGQRLQMAVNVSTTQLMTRGFPRTVSSVLANTLTDPADLVLEMTEAIFIEDSERAGRVLQSLKALGVSVALDDFGTGYCSLNYLRRYPVDVLKIDQAFLVDVASDPVGAPFLGAVTQLAHLLGLSVIAEGVETVRQHDEVSAAGCESSQGFYYAKPMPAEEIAILLEAGLNRPPNLPRATTIELPAQRIRA